MSDLGSRLRHERERRGIGLREAAEETGVSFNTLSRIERGHDCRYSHALSVLAWLGRTDPSDDTANGGSVRMPEHPLDCLIAAARERGDEWTEALHDWLTAWVIAHDAGDMTDDETLAVFDFIAELRRWIGGAL